MGDHRTVNDAHDSMRDPLASVDISEWFTNTDLDDKVCQRERDFSQQNHYERDDPKTLPRQPWQTTEEDRVQEIACRMQSELGGCLGHPRWESCPPFVIVEGVEGADHALNDKEPQS